MCISKCLPKVPAMPNDFLHSVVHPCGFSPLLMNMYSFNFPVCVNDFFHCAQCEWPYECSDFELSWITFCILCTCVVSLHWGWACVGLCDCRLVAFVCILSSVCFAVISHERLFRVEKLHWLNFWAMGIEEKNWAENGWYIGNCLEEETTEDVGGMRLMTLMQILYSSLY